MMGQIFTHSDLTTNVDARCDVCIVGSGAGGAVLAKGLVERGLSVIMLEEGSHYTRKDFTGHEAWAFPHLYQDRGGRFTSDQAISVLQGRSVGGSTTVNWTTSFRTPERILRHWERVHGVQGLDAASLEPHFKAVETRLNIKKWEATPNRNNQVIQRGCEALGWQYSTLYRNVKGCANSGYCGMGCPVDGKQAMGLTYLDDGLKRGLQIYANTRAERLEMSQGRVVAIHARVMGPEAPVPDGSTVVIRPKVAVCSAGAINGPALLLRSGLDQGGLVGRRTFIHPVVGITGLHAEPIIGWFGAPQSLSSHQFIDRGPDKVGFFIEVAPVFPMLSAISLRMFGAVSHEFMSQLKYASYLIALGVDGLMPGDEGGTVSVQSDGRISLDYPVQAHHTEMFREAHTAMARMKFAAGAREVRSTHINSVVLHSEADLPKLEAASYGAHKHGIFTAHQMGGCPMGSDPERSVVDNNLRFRGVDNLFVVDGSVLPTALGVNPSQTIYSIARWARDRVAEAV